MTWGLDKAHGMWYTYDMRVRNGADDEDKLGEVSIHSPPSVASYLLRYLQHR